MINKKYFHNNFKGKVFLMKRLFVFIVVITLCVQFASASRYDDMLAEMRQLTQNHPEYIEMMDIGKNDQKKIIYGLKVKNPDYTRENGKKPNQLLVGCHHGNEGLSADVCIVFVNDLIDIFKSPSHPRYAAISKSVFYVIPVLNISGYDRNNRREKDKNGRYHDPNRDYPDPCANNSYYKLESTKNLAKFVKQKDIVGAVTTHGYIGTFTYPWGMNTDNTHTNDHSIYNNIAKQAVAANGYMIGTHADAIYPASGSFEDWAYHAYGVWVMLLEHDYGANLDKDSECLIIFFALIPDKQSQNHEHNSSFCRASREDAPSRP